MGIGDALQLVSTDREMRKDLSAPVAEIASAIDAGAGAALGLAGSLSDAGSKVLGDLAGKLTGELSGALGAVLGGAITAVPAAIPMVGAAVKVLTAAFQGSGDANAADCSLFFEAFKVKGSGSILAGGSSVPADIFARIYTGRGKDNRGDDLEAPFDVAQVAPGDGKYRSAFGMALMQITEGYPIDAEDLSAKDWKALAGELDEKEFRAGDIVKSLFSASVRRDMLIAPKQWKKAHLKAVKTKGLPYAWAKRFRTLRRGIEASRNKDGSDGGVALWVIYLDLLTTAFRRMYLSQTYIEWIYRRPSSFYWMGSPPAAFGKDMAYLFGQESIMKNKLHWAKVDPDGKGAFKDPAAMVWRTMMPAMRLVAPAMSPFVYAWGHDPCPRMVANMIKPQVENWERAVRPKYAQGKEAIAKLGADDREACPGETCRVYLVNRASGASVVWSVIVPAIEQSTIEAAWREADRRNRRAGVRIWTVEVG